MILKRMKMGFDRVYPPETDLKTAMNDLWNDLRARGKV
jgi:methylmalonyl-CoA mutase cobalamin-binding subunit